MTNAAPVRLLIAVHTREVKAGLFLSLNGHPSATIVATATTTAELVSYCRSFEPDVAIVEDRLPGRPMYETLLEAQDASPKSRFLLIEGTDLPTELRPPRVDIFTDLDQLVSAIPDQGADGR